MRGRRSQRRTPVLVLKDDAGKAGRVDISFNAIGIPNPKIRVPLVELDVEQFSLPIATYMRSYLVTAPLIIESDDLRKDFDVLRSLGVEFADPEPESYPFGMRVTALDPDGNRVSLRQTRK